MKTSNAEIASYRIEWHVYLMGKKEPYILTAEQHTALRDAVASGKSVIFFSSFDIGLNSIRDIEQVRVPVYPKDNYIAVDHDGNPVE